MKTETPSATGTASPAASPPARNSAGWRSTLFAAIFFIVVAVVLQQFAGSYGKEFGSEPDEAAHYVTGLCVRDYVAAGFPGNPLGYAKKYYEHYPKVALGHWPPVFYLVQTAWTLGFTPSRESVVTLMAVLAALIATLTFAGLRAEFGPLVALSGGLVFLLFPLVQEYAGNIMTEIPVALFALAATCFFGRYLDRERTADAVGFGLMAALTILTKFSGLFLVLVPPLAVLFARKFHLMKRMSFWWPAVVAALVCGPWVAFTAKLSSEGWREESVWGWAYTSKAIPYYLGQLCTLTGTAVFLLAVLGLALILFGRGRTGRFAGTWAALAAMLAGILLQHFIMPVSYETRHLIPALAVLALFAGAGAAGAADWLTGKGLSRGLALALVIGFAGAAFAAETFHVPHKVYRGFGAVADFLMNRPEAKRAVFLVVSDARGEGMFISEVAMRERRPGHVIRRGSKELASVSWSGSKYKPKFADSVSLTEFLRTNGVDYVVLDRSFPAVYRKDYHDLLEAAVAAAPETFLPQGQFAVQRAGELRTNSIVVYQVAK